MTNRHDAVAVAMLLIIAVSLSHAQPSPPPQQPSPSPPPPIPPAGVQVRQTSKGVVVQWGKSLQPEILGYHVYRAGVGKARERIATRVAGTEFLDPVPVKGKLYRYTVTAVSKDRGESLPSEEVTVRR